MTLNENLQEKEALDVLNMIRSVQMVLQSGYEHVKLFSKQNVDYQNLIKEEIVSLLKKNKYYYSNLYVVFKGTYEQDKSALKKALPFLDSFSSFNFLQKDITFESEFHENDIDYNMIRNIQNNDDIHPYLDLLLLMTFTCIPRKFHYFLLESDADSFVSFINSFSIESIKLQFATAAFVSPLFIKFVQETITPFIKELNGSTFLTGNDVMNKIKLSLFENRGKCPQVIIKLLLMNDIADKMFCECFLQIMKEQPFLYGLNHYYDTSNFQKFIDEWKRSAQTFVNIITIQPQIDNAIQLMNKAISDKESQKKLNREITSLMNVLQFFFNSTIKTLISAAQRNISNPKLNRKSINYLQKQFSILFVPNDYLCFSKGDEEKVIITESFKVVFYDSFDDKCNDLFNSQINGKISQKDFVKQEYQVRAYANDLIINSKDDHTQFIDVGSDEGFREEFINFRELLKIIPLVPCFDKLPLSIKPIKGKTTNNKYFNLLEFLQCNLLQSAQINGIQYIDNLYYSNFSSFAFLHNKSSCNHIKTLLDKMIIEHDHNRTEVLSLKQIIQKISDINNSTMNIFNETNGRRDYIFITEEKVLPVIQKENRNPYQDPTILFQGTDCVYNQIRKLVKNRTQTVIYDEICLHFIYKLISYQKFIKNRPEISSFDHIFTYFIQQNLKSILNNIENEFIKLHETQLIGIDLQKLFHDFNPKLLAISSDFSKALQENSDPLQKISNFEEIFAKLHSYYSNLMYNDNLFEQFIEYFLAFFSPTYLFSNVIFLEEYYYCQRKIEENRKDFGNIQILLEFVKKYLQIYNNTPLIQFLKSREIVSPCCLFFSDDIIRDSILVNAFDMNSTNLKSNIQTFNKKIIINEENAVLMKISICQDITTKMTKENDVFCFVSNQKQMITLYNKNKKLNFICNCPIDIHSSIPSDQIFILDSFPHLNDYVKNYFKLKFESNTMK